MVSTGKSESFSMPTALSSRSWTCTARLMHNSVPMGGIKKRGTNSTFLHRPLIEHDKDDRRSLTEHELVQTGKCESSARWKHLNRGTSLGNGQKVPSVRREQNTL